MTARFPIALLLCLLRIHAAQAEGSLLPDGHLDTVAVRDAYLRADIPFVKSALEAYIRSHPKDVTVAEKAFTHLYLGAAYAGEPEGRGRSEAHFRAALKFAPDADPANLYLPPAARDGFENLRAEALAAARPATPAIAAMPSATSSGVPATSGPSETSSAPPGPDPAPTSAGPAAPTTPTAPPEPIASTMTDPADAGAPVPSPSLGGPLALASPVGPPVLASPGASPAPGDAPAPGPAQAIAADRPRGWIWWAVGGGAALAAGTGAFAWIESRAASSPHRVQVDATLK